MFVPESLVLLNCPASAADTAVLFAQTFTLIVCASRRVSSSGSRESACRHHAESGKGVVAAGPGPAETPSTSA